MARYEPASGLVMPRNIAVRPIPALSRLGLTDRNGLTLYTFDGTADDLARACNANCQRRWLPLLGSGLSNPVGPFTLVVRSDGLRQWAYRNAPLFRYRDDQVAGDARGVGENENARWQAVELARYFMPADVRVRPEIKHGRILSTTGGLPLYTRNAYERSIKRVPVYQRGKLLGTGACDAVCLQRWRPFLAPPDARPQGYWEIYQRPEGTRQWAYKGFALYTYIDDQPNGVAQGHFEFDYTVGDEGRYSVSDAAAAVSIDFTPTGFFWAVGTP